MKKLKSEKQTEMISNHGSSQLRTNFQQSRYENKIQAKVLLFKISVLDWLQRSNFINQSGNEQKFAIWALASEQKQLIHPIAWVL